VKLDGARLRLSASDVANFLACGHLTRLDLLWARGELRPPYQADSGFEDLVRRGEAHERAVLDAFRAVGYGVMEIANAPDTDAARATVAATRDGADVIYQGVLRLDPASDGPALFGRPDFLDRQGPRRRPGGVLLTLAGLPAGHPASLDAPGPRERRIHLAEG
jgi:hypothetical protein